LGSTINTNAIEKNGEFYLQDGPNQFGYSSYGVPNNPLSGYNFQNSLVPVKESPFGGNIGIKALNTTASLSLGTSSYDNNPLAGLEYSQVTGGGRLDLKVQTWGTGSDYALTTGLTVLTPGFDTNNVRVGIGTVSPATPLHVTGGASGTGGWNRTATLAATYPGLIFNSNGTKWGGMAYDYSAAMRFWVNANNDDIFAGTLALSILNNGNVGIGTSNPIYKLQVAGSAYVNGGTLFIDSGQYLRWGNSNQGIVGVNDSHVAIVSGGATRQTVYADGRTYFPGLDLSISNINGSHGSGTYFRGDGSHFVFGLSDGNTLYLNYGNSSGILRTFGTWYHESTQILSTSRVLTNVSGNISMFTNDAGYLTSVSDVWVNTSGDTMTGALTIQGGWASTILDGDNVVLRKPNYSAGGWARTLLNFQEYDTTSLFQIGGYGSNNVMTYGYLGSAYNTPTIKWYANKNVYFSGNILIDDAADNNRYQKGATFLNLRDPWNNLHLSTDSIGGNYIDANVHYWRPAGGASYWMTLNGGNLGIGTTSPAENLHVVGRGIFDGGSGNSSTDAVLYVTKSNNNDWGLYVNAVGLDYGMYARVSPSAGYAIAVNNGTTWTTRITGDGRIYLNEKDTIASYDTWLRLNESSHYGSGVYTPGLMRADGGFQVSGSTVWHAGNDGSGSGLDADTVDGVQADSIVYGNARGTNDSVTTNNNDLDKTGYYTSDSFATKPSGVANWMYIEHIKLYNANTAYQKQLGYDTYDDRMWVRTKSGGAWSSWKQIWTSDSLTNLSQLTNGPGYITSSALSSYATTSYVTTQINNLINGAPGALDTLSELASALGNDSNFATTVTNSIAGKVSKSGDTMTGNLTTTGLTVGNGVATGRQPYGPLANANIILTSSAADSSGVCGIEFLSGNNYPSDGASIYFQNNANGGSERAKLTIRVENDQEDFIELRAGKVVINANTYSGGGQNPAVVFQHNDSQIASITSGGQIDASGGNSSQWNTAYGWGDHSSVGYALNSSLANYLPLSGGVIGGAVTINGNLTVNGTITENSSIKLKENVETSEGNLEKVVNLRPVTYNKIGSQTTELGLIAEEVAEVYPEFVQYDENGEPVGVHYSRLTAALIGAVKELNEQLQELKRNK